MPEHNYIVKLKRLEAEGKTPQSGLYYTDIRHDDWCGIFRGRRCNCDPDIGFVKVAGAAIVSRDREERLQ